MILLELISNLALLVALCSVSGFIEHRWPRGSRRANLLLGLLFGTVAVIGILKPFVYSPGLIFDGRSVVISVCGLFYGGGPTFVAAAMAIICRAALGGTGMWMGVLVTLCSAGLGIHAYRLRREGRFHAGAGGLLGFGFVVHLAMLAMTVALPPDQILPVLRRISLPVILTYPVATLLIGSILVAGEERAQLLADVRTSEAKYRHLYECLIDGFVGVDMQGRLQLWNPAFEAILGYSESELRTLTYQDLTPERWHASEARIVAEQVLVRGYSDLYEKEYRRRDGRVFPVELRTHLLRDASGQPVGMWAIVRDITERKQAEANLRASLEDKEILLKEIHHRVKNNLQVVSSLLNLEMRQIDHPAAQAFLRDAQNRVHSMALLHETLYRSETISRVNFPSYVRTLCEHIARSHAGDGRHVHIRHRLDDVHLDLDQAVTLGLIINELVSNSFKHAFPNRRPGTISLNLEPSDTNRLRLRIEDDGVGLPADFAPTQLTTLGLRLVDSLVSQLGGSWKHAPAPGTAWDIEFPLRHPVRENAG